MNSSLFYTEKPVFGFDLGRSSIKIMQIDTFSKVHRVKGYGYTSFDPKAIKDGVIIDPEIIAKEAYALITENMIGEISTQQVAASVPVSQTFSRVLSLPKMADSDLKDAVHLEAEQYIPIPLDDLYLDYEVSPSSNKDDDNTEVLVVAAQKKVVDSYLTLFELLNLEVAVVEASINATTRLVMHAEETDLPTLIIDFGSVSTDLSIFDTTLRITGTVDNGGETITKAIAKMLKVSESQAQTIKNKHGLSAGKKQAQIRKALEPMLTKMVSEIKKMVRFYQERSGEKRKLEQVIILGGGANMPGLADYLTDKIRIPTRLCNPWLNLDFSDLQPPHDSEKTLYATASGLTLATMEKDG